jgi:hypothetical protein
MSIFSCDALACLTIVSAGGQCITGPEWCANLPNLKPGQWAAAHDVLVVSVARQTFQRA